MDLIGNCESEYTYKHARRNNLSTFSSNNYRQNNYDEYVRLRSGGERKKGKHMPG